MPEELAGGKVLLDYPVAAVARLTLNRPESLNALNHETLDAITAAMPTLDRGNEVRCVILTGAGRAFSSGYDITSFSKKNLAADAEALLAHPFAAVLGALASHPWPVIGALNGHALGGGLELALCCDLRICAESAKLGMPPAKLGVIYGHTGLRRIIEAIGVPDTKLLFISGRNVDAAHGQRIGLVHETVADERLEDAALELAAEIADNAPLALRGNKLAIDTLAANPILSPEQERQLIELRESCFASEDFQAAIEAFEAKHKPKWKGR